MSDNKVTLIHVGPGEKDEAPVTLVEIDGNAICDIILAHGAPPRAAIACANAIMEYLSKAHRDAGAQGLQ